MSALPMAARSLGDVAQELDVTWTIVAGALVMFMQAGFACVEMGFSRSKNAGTVVAKILLNFSVASLAWWVCGFAIAFGGAGLLAGHTGFAFSATFVPPSGSPIPEQMVHHVGAFSFFQLVFCAVSLAIVWGTTLERIRFIAYPIFAVIFAALIYPVVAHWIFGGGLLGQLGTGMQDFAGSTVVHLTGATAGLAALVLLGPRRDKYGPGGRPRAIPGHSMPLFGLGVLILWLGWFGFNPGSTLSAANGRFADIVVVTNMAAAAGAIGAAGVMGLTTRKLDVGMVGNGVIAALVAITAPSGFVEFWAAPLIGLVAGAIVVPSVLLIDRVLDDPVGALSAHGVAGIWGTLACGLFSSPRIIGENDLVGQGGLVYTGSFEQLGVQAAGVALTFVVVFSLSYLAFAGIKAVFGLRVTDDEERDGLDIVEHGMYGYPEQFIEPAEAASMLGADPIGPPARSTP